MKRASYREAIAWIALNDEAGLGGESVDVERVSELVTSSLVADIFAVDRERVGRDVVRFRLNEAQRAATEAWAQGKGQRP